MAEKYAELGGTLKELRQGLGATQSTMAKHLGINQARVSQYEKGSVRPAPERLLQIAVALEVQALELFEIAGFTAEELDLASADLEKKADEADLPWEQPARILLEEVSIHEETLIAHFSNGEQEQLCLPGTQLEALTDIMLRTGCRLRVVGAEVEIREEDRYNSHLNLQKAANWLQEQEAK